MTELAGIVVQEASETRIQYLLPDGITRIVFCGDRLFEQIAELAKESK